MSEEFLNKKPEVDRKEDSSNPELDSTHTEKLSSKQVELETDALAAAEPIHTLPEEATLADSPLSTEEPAPRTGPNYTLFGFGAVAFLLLAIVAMLVITAGDVSETPAPASLSQIATEGKTLFLNNDCNNCHPKEGRAGGTGPRLSTTGVSDDTIRNTIRRGKGAMPSNSLLTDEQLNKVVAYIRAIKPPPATNRLQANS